MPSDACVAPRPRGRPHVRLCAAALLLAGAPSLAQVQTADTELPILSRLGGADALAAVAVSPDGSVAVAAEAQAEGDRSTVLRVVSIDGGELARLDVRGNVLGIVFAPAGDLAFLVAHRPAKKTDGESLLYTLGLADTKLRRARSLPPTAAGLDVWTEQRTIVVASRDEIRSFLLPDLRSGPLYRIPGFNLSVTSIGGSSRMLIGQRNRLLLVDLNDPPGEDAMPIRDEVELGAPAVAMAAARDGSRALVRLETGRLLEVSFDPLSLRDAGTVTALASRPAITSPPPVAEPVVVQRIEPSVEEPKLPTVAPEGGTAPRRPADSPEELPDSSRAQPADAVEVSAAAAVGAAAATDDTPVATDEPIAEAPGPASAETTTDEPSLESPGEPVAGIPESATVAAATDEPDASATAPQAPATVGASPEPVPSPTPPPADPGDDGPPGERVTGSISGPRPPNDLFVVLFGPDNMIREAARVPVDREGRWEIEGLAPGRYRVQLDAGGSTVLVTDPQFRILDLKQDEPSDSLDFRVVREL